MDWHREHDGRKKGGVRGITSRRREKQDGYAILRRGNKPHSKV